MDTINYKELKKGDAFGIPQGWTEEQIINSIAKKYSVEKSDFICHGNSVIYIPSTSKYVPKGHTTDYVWNKKERKFEKIFIPVEGFSKEFLTKDFFVPTRTMSIINSNCESNEGVEGKSNKSLHKARKLKNDEFYTRIDDVIKELQHYEKYFKGAVIYCPCDKVYIEGRSAFADYFFHSFHKLGVKKLICTQYNPNGHGVAEIFDFDNSKDDIFNGKGIAWEYNGEKEDGFVDEIEVPVKLLEGDGSFDSQECKKYMQECDIVITNPPFSLFKEFVKQILDFNKKFLIIGSMNAITYKETFQYIKDNKMWLGYNCPKHFEVPLKKVVNEKNQYEENGKIYQSFGNICWYTNLEHNKRKEEIGLYKKYSPEDYKKYDNYDAIEVSRITDIPEDYDGIMGVPITFLFKHCPSQFELIWTSDRGGDGNIEWLKVKNQQRYDAPTINGTGKYKRIFIRKVSQAK